MRGINEHLSIQELERLTGADADAATDALEDAMRHLESCDGCRFRLLGLEPHEKAPSGDTEKMSECPTEKVWLDLAAGLLQQSEVRPLLGHAVKCGYCGPLLKIAIEDLAMEFMPEEEARVKTLESSKPEWQKDLVRKIVADVASDEGRIHSSEIPSSVVPLRKSSDSKRSVAPHVRWVWMAVAAAVVIVIGAWLILRLRSGNDPNELMARASVSPRTIELRYPGAPYAPMHVNRGPAAEVRESLDLMKAKPIIAEQLAAHPGSVRWLQAQARADLLQWKYGRALTELEAALVREPGNVSLQLDKAMALYEKAVRDSSKTPDADGQLLEYGRAAAILTDVLKQDPNNLIALFNLAILNEKLSNPHEAIQDWDRYLSLDPTSDWAQEARKKLENLKNRTTAHLKARSEPLASAQEFVRRNADSVFLAVVDERVEDYLDQAVNGWLPIAVKAGPESDAAQALALFSRVLKDQHHDSWLYEFAISRDSVDFQRATIGLKESLAALDAGEWDRALQIARSAEELFSVAGSRPGRVRAELAEIHALQRDQKAESCLKAVALLQSEIAGSAYLWIETQLKIEESGCLSMQGRFDEARAVINSAEQEASQSGFLNLRLRSLGIAAAVETDEGNLTEGWGRNEMGLAEYWQSDASDPVRAHQFYDNLMEDAEGLGLVSVALAFGRENALATGLTSNRSVEAQIHVKLAELAAQTNEPDMAAAELASARKLLAFVKSAKSSSIRISVDIDQAQIEIDQGRAKAAAASLDALEPLLDRSGNFEVPLRFYRIYSQAMESLQEPSRATQALRKAIEITESNLSRTQSAASRYFLSQESSRLYRRLTQLELLHGDPEQALAIWEWYRSEPIRSRTLATTELNPFLQSVSYRRGGPAGRSNVVYAILANGVAIWVADGRGVHSKFVETDTEVLLRRSEYFNDLCSDPNSDLNLLKEQGRDLYGILLRPVSDYLAGIDTLVVELDEQMGSLALEALVAEDGRYGGERFLMSFSPGMVYERYLRETAPISDTQHALVVGSTLSSGEDVFPLTNIEDEVRSVAGHFRHPDVLLGADATATNLEAALPRSDLFDYAGHAVTNRQAGGLLLAREPGRNSKRSALWKVSWGNSSLFRRCRLVVLFACSTGIRNRSRLEQRADIVNDMFLSRVPQIVASRWDVDSEVAGKLKSYFYEALLHGAAPATALSVAAQKMRAESRHPAQWAAFALFGRI